MDYELLFVVLNASVMPAWLLLVFAPGWRGTELFVKTLIVPMLMAVAYIGLLIAGLPGSEGSFASLSDVRLAFQSDPLLLLGWTHYLCFDLMVGTWEVQDSQKLGIPHLLVVPCLFFTLMLGPIGFLMYMTVRFALENELSIDARSV